MYLLIQQYFYYLFLSRDHLNFLLIISRLNRPYITFFYQVKMQTLFSLGNFLSLYFLCLKMSYNDINKILGGVFKTFF